MGDAVGAGSQTWEPCASRFGSGIRAACGYSGETRTRAGNSRRESGWFTSNDARDHDRCSRRRLDRCGSRGPGCAPRRGVSRVRRRRSRDRAQRARTSGSRREPRLSVVAARHGRATQRRRDDRRGGIPQSGQGRRLAVRGGVAVAARRLRVAAQRSPGRGEDIRQADHRGERRGRRRCRHRDVSHRRGRERRGRVSHARRRASLAPARRSC